MLKVDFHKDKNDTDTWDLRHCWKRHIKYASKENTEFLGFSKVFLFVQSEPHQPVSLPGTQTHSQTFTDKKKKQVIWPKQIAVGFLWQLSGEQGFQGISYSGVCRFRLFGKAQSVGHFPNREECHLNLAYNWKVGKGLQTWIQEPQRSNIRSVKTIYLAEYPRKLTVCWICFQKLHAV